MVNKKENVWDFPRPAICEPFNGSLKVVVSGKVIAKTDKGFRSLETSPSPSYCILPDDIQMNSELLSKDFQIKECDRIGISKNNNRTCHNFNIFFIIQSRSS